MGRRCVTNMGRRGYLKILLWIVLIGVALQFLDYDWNILKFSHYLSTKQSLQLSFPPHKDVVFGAHVDGHNIKGQYVDSKPPHLDDAPYSLPTDLHLRMIVITFNRAKSVDRLLQSLNSALYFGDKVGIDVWIDRSKEGHIHEETYVTAKKFKFQHGVITVHNQTVHAGIYGQWMKTWNPSPDSKEIAIILEDDLTVSKYFYKWLKNVHKKYDSLPYINGYALQGYSMKHGGAAGQLRAPDENMVFMYPILGTWGFSPSHQNWINYVKWYDETSKVSTFQPLVPGILPTSWYKQFTARGKAGGMWSMWHIYHAWKFKLQTIYPNLPGKVGLAINWKEAGLHYVESQTNKKKSDPILTAWDPKFENLPDEPIHLNVNGRVCPRSQYI